jgi:uncharacterized protein (TIGR00251 family)
MRGGQAWMAVADGLLVQVRLTPKGGRDAIDGIVRLADGQAVLKARVRAAASDGEANAALVRLLAGALETAPRRVSIVAGTTARLKQVKIEGDAAGLATLLARFAGPGGGG